MKHWGRTLLRFFRDEKHWEKMSFFSGVSIFQGLSARQLGRVTQFLQHRRYRAGELLFCEGQVGKAVFIIETGKVEISRKTVSGPPRSLAVLGPGQVFGEMALLDSLERTASATVIEDGIIYFLYTASLDALIRQYPDVGVIVLRNMASILSLLLRQTNKELDHWRNHSVAL